MKDEEWEQDDLVDEDENAVPYWIRCVHMVAYACFLAIYEVGSFGVHICWLIAHCTGRLLCAISYLGHLSFSIVRSVRAVTIGILVSITKLYFFWVFFCLAVHVVDWSQGRHGFLAATVFCRINPTSVCYSDIWGHFMPLVTSLTDILHPFSIVWTVFLPLWLDDIGGYT